MRHAYYDLNECASAEVTATGHTLNIPATVLGLRKNCVETFPIETGEFIFSLKFFEKVLSNSFHLLDDSIMRGAKFVKKRGGLSLLCWITPIIIVLQTISFRR